MSDVLTMSSIASSLQHVRCVEVVAADASPPSRVEELDCGERPQDTWQYYAPYSDPSLAINDSEWLLFAQMVIQFSGLRSLRWGCLQQIPSCVLQAIEPRCHLDVPSFSLRSLFQRPMEPIEINAHELALACSPCLKSLCLRFDFRDDGLSNYNYYAVMDMAAGAAPNLREVALLYESSGSSPMSLRDIGTRSQPWRHDLLPRFLGAIGELTCLELCVRETGARSESGKPKRTSRPFTLSDYTLKWTQTQYVG